MEPMLNKKIFTIVLILVLLVGTIMMASAMSISEQNTLNKMTNPFSQIQYGLTKGLFFFTTWGQANGCSTTPDSNGAYGGWEGWVKKGEVISCSKIGKTKCAIDIWYDDTLYNTAFKGPPSSPNWNNWYKEITGTNAYFMAFNYAWYYVQIYGCPSTAPALIHNTQVYICQNNGWINRGSYTQTESCPYDPTGHCWCSSTSDNFYKDLGGNVHCRPSTYLSVTDGSWCPTSTPTNPTCETCSSLSYSCGTKVNSCGTTLDCGTCSSGSSCVSNQCVLNPLTCTDRITLGTYITQWQNNSITRDILGSKIQEWSNC